MQQQQPRGRQSRLQLHLHLPLQALAAALCDRKIRFPWLILTQMWHEWSDVYVIVSVTTSLPISAHFRLPVGGESRRCVYITWRICPEEQHICSSQSNQHLSLSRARSEGIYLVLDTSPEIYLLQSEEKTPIIYYQYYLKIPHSISTIYNKKKMMMKSAMNVSSTTTTTMTTIQWILGAIIMALMTFSASAEGNCICAAGHRSFFSSFVLFTSTSVDGWLSIWLYESTLIFPVLENRIGFYLVSNQ